MSTAVRNAPKASELIRWKRSSMPFHKVQEPRVIGMLAFPIQPFGKPVLLANTRGQESGRHDLMLVFELLIIACA